MFVCVSCSPGINPITKSMPLANIIIFSTSTTLVDGAWGPWGHWTDCSLSCAGGQQSRSRFCDSPLPGGGGSFCTSNTSFWLSMTPNNTMKEVDTQSCNNNNCPTTTTTTTPPAEGKIKNSLHSERNKLNYLCKVNTM